MNRKYRNTIIAANLKMNMLPSNIKAYAEALKPAAATHGKRCGIVVCPSFVLVPQAVKAFRDSRVSVGAQNVSQFESGAYTGEVSAPQLSDLGARYVIIGHSERRTLFGDTNETVNLKVHAALAANLRPIICVGETLTQREMGVTNDVITLQVKSALAGVGASKMRRIVIAYEPVWAIGTGLAATEKDAAAVCREIRSLVRSLYGARIARAVSILYGGSMNVQNAKGLLSQPDIDGGLIGSASLSPESLSAIIEIASHDYV